MAAAATPTFFLDVKSRFEDSDPQKFAAFQAIFVEGSTQLMDMPAAERDSKALEVHASTRAKLATLFSDDPDLIEGFDQFWADSTGPQPETPQTIFINRVRSRFENDPLQLQAFQAPFEEAMQKMVRAKSTQEAKEAWNSVQVLAWDALASEPDLLAEFEEVFLQQQKLLETPRSAAAP